jgi:hypothetical protein
MKIKVDHVTNSSSEVFGVVLADSAVTVGLLFMLDSITNGYRSLSSDQVQDKLYDEMLLESEKIASRITEDVLEDARTQEKIVKDAYTEALSTLDKVSSSLSQEMSQVKKNWETYDKTADKTSSDYALAQKKNDDYLEYLKFQLKQLELQKSSVEKSRQEKTALINSRDAWVQQNQADLITLNEQESLLNNLNAAYYKVTGDEGLWLRSPEEMDSRKAELNEALLSANETLSYKATSKDELHLSDETTSLMKQIASERKAFELEVSGLNEADKLKMMDAYEKKTSKMRSDLINATRFDLSMNASTSLKYGTETALEGLSDLAGPQFKIAYSALKTMVTGIKDAKKDPKNKSKHLAKALISVSANALKDQLSDTPWAQDATSVLNTVLQGSLSASIAGTSTASAIGTSLTKGIFEVGAEKGIASLKESTSSEKKAIESNFEMMSVEEVLTDNPLTQTLNGAIKAEIIFV